MNVIVLDKYYKRRIYPIYAHNTVNNEFDTGYTVGLCFSSDTRDSRNGDFTSCLSFNSANLLLKSTAFNFQIFEMSWNSALHMPPPSGIQEFKMKDKKQR